MHAGVSGTSGAPGSAASDVPTLAIVALAARAEPDPAAVWEWFFGTPIWPFGRTAWELVQAGRSDRVMAFLQRLLRDGD